MAQQDDPRTDGAATSAPSHFTTDIAKKSGEAMTGAQAEFLDRLREINEHWLDRAKLEADLASKLLSKLTSARSVPETVTALQDWASQRAKLAIDHVQQIVGDKLAATGARLISGADMGGGEPDQQAGAQTTPS